MKTIVGLISGALCGVLFFLAAFWLAQRFDVIVPLKNQPLQIRINDALRVSARVGDPLDVSIRETLSIEAPLKQTVAVPVAESVPVMAKMHGPVRVMATIPIDQSIQLDQAIPIDTEVEAHFLGGTHRIPLKGLIPIKASIPLRFDLPVDQDVNMDLNAPMMVELDHVFSVALDTTLRSEVLVSGRLQLPLLDPMQANVTIHNDSIPMTIVEADLSIDPRQLSFGR